MIIDILTLFPAMFDGPLTESILKRAQERGLLTVRRHDIRAYATDKHHTTDDTPYGGGGGMVMRVGPLVAAVEDVRGADTSAPVILLTPQGRVFTQRVATELAAHDRLILVCGRYEGVDERVRQSVITDEISIGDYVLTGGGGRQAPAGRPREQRQRGGRELHDGAPRVPAVHPPARVPRPRGAGGAPERQPRADRPLAARAGA